MNQSLHNGGGTGKPTAAAATFRAPPQRQPPPAAPNAGAGPPLGLSRCDSAAGSFLAGGGGFTKLAFMGRFLSTQSPCMTSESSSNVASAGAVVAVAGSPPPAPQRFSYGMFAGSELTMGTSRSGVSGGSPMTRHGSSPAGFFSRLMADDVFSGMMDTGSYSRAGTDTTNSMANTRMKSQLSFSNHSTLSQISELSISEMGGRSNNSDESSRNVGRPYVTGNFIGSWDESNSIMFSSPSSKRTKDANGDIITISNLEPEYGLSKSSLDMSTLEKYLQMQHDEVQFKVRAKRGFATHPRSIAERERRTRISEKLRRLQELVPNMDKQTNTAEMLDLALQHIKGLQSQVQILTQEQDHCTCSGRK